MMQMISRFAGMPDARFTPVARLASRDMAQLLEALEPAEDDSPVCWRDGNSLVAAQGVWLREGGFRARHGSFVDPSDLSVYGRQYYEAREGGRAGFAVSYGPPDSADVQAVRTAAELKRVLAERSGVSAGEQDMEPPAVPLPLLLQPSSAFELHGKLVAGWNIRVYQADDETGTEILVFE